MLFLHNLYVNLFRLRCDNVNWATGTEKLTFCIETFHKHAYISSMTAFYINKHKYGDFAKLRDSVLHI